MIDEYWTWIFYGYHSYELAECSHKPIVVRCEECCKYRVSRMQQYRDLCKSCVQAGKRNRNYGLSWTIADIHRLSGDKSPNWRGGNPMVECFTCGAIFEIKRELNVLSDYHFCCNTCKSVWSSSRMTDFYSDITNREKQSAAAQGISYDEWEGFAKDKPYCPAFNEKCRESNREKYDRKCFLCGLEESGNVTSAGTHRKLAVHHYDMNKEQGCDSHEWKLVPLCICCHGSAHNDLIMNRIIYLLNNVWYKV